MKTIRFGIGTMLGIIVLIAGAVDAQAQRVIPGFQRVDQSDVSGVTVTSSDLVRFGDPGAPISITCPVAWGIRDAAYDLANGAAEGSDARVDARMRALLNGGAAADPAEPALFAALTAQNARARRDASRLIRDLRGLFGAIEAMDPRNPGVEGPARLASALRSFNAFVDASSHEFLGAPSREFTAIRSTLAQLAEAAARNEAREPHPYVVDDRGLACAPVVAAAFTPPVDRQIRVCTLHPNGEFAYLDALISGESGDTIVMMNGQRVAFSETSPARGKHAGDAPWRIAQDEIAVGESRYLPYGLYRTVRPGDVTRVAQYDGVAVFTLGGETMPAEYIYLPVTGGCEVQPYRKVEEIRGVRG